MVKEYDHYNKTTKYLQQKKRFGLSKNDGWTLWYGTNWKILIDQFSRLLRNSMLTTCNLRIGVIVSKTIPFLRDRLLLEGQKNPPANPQTPLAGSRTSLAET